MVQGQNDPAAEPLRTDQAVPPPKKTSRGGVRMKVLLLDGSEFETQLPKTALGRELVDQVCEHLSLVEKDYFSCSYRDRHNVRLWIHDDRPLSKPGKRAAERWTFSFEVKFYPLDASALHEDYTRYLIFLQTRVDIVMGKLPSSFLALALLGSYGVQSDMGDYSSAEHKTGSDYIKDIKFAPKQSEELLDKIAELHQTHRGMRPDEAEMSYLESAEKLALYGMHMHEAKQADDNMDVRIGVGGTGLVIYKDTIRLHRFPWAKILKIAYKRNTFTVKIRPEQPNEPQQVLVYRLGSNILAKRLWRIAVEHHGFFRLKEPEAAQRAQFPHFGSKFRYSGRTQYQVQGTSEPKGRIVPKINRKASTRFTGAKAGNFNYNTGTGGFSTDRGEQTMVISDSPSNTLDLKKLGKRPAITQRADFEDDHNLSVIDPGGNYGREDSVAMSGGQVTYTKQGYQTGAGYDQYGNPIDGDTSADFSSADNTLSGRYGTNNSRYGADGNDNSLRYQDDQLKTAAGGAVGGAGQWGGASGASSKTKTSTRTYTEADGTVVTEEITEKDGVIERKVRRHKQETRITVSATGGDDIDYDKALADAIQSVTNMDQGLSVEKIEIHTKSETAH